MTGPRREETAAGGAVAEAAPGLAAALAGEGLAVLGGFHPGPGDGAPAGAGTLLLVGPEAPGFWPRFRSSAEASDGAPDPLDRWTMRVLGRIAADFGAGAVYPFGGPPWAPFAAWAARTGRVWTSPVGLLVHDRAGLFLSFRGALAFPGRLPVPAAGRRPCDGCAAACRTACPVAALTPGGYDVAACRDFVASASGAGCREEGCAVRRACPVGRDRMPPRGQRAFHMAAFHGRQGP